MSVGYAGTVQAIDPNSGQLIELPFDQTGTYVIQDGSLLPSNQLPAGAQGGKSLLKPELAQHLNQHGFKPTIGRGGFTMGSTESRWGPTGSPRTNRNIPRKPLTGGNQTQSGSVSLSQGNTPLVSASSGILSLGSRYTPSSGSSFGVSAALSGGSLVAPGSAATLMPANMDRDSNFRLAAAIAGTSGRGRPRGRRPLRGQFPVVPIDMVRQLGIEQQVILQPAAPVAMRNKAVLCRPLSMCRKTQVSVVQYENAQENSLPVTAEGLGGPPFRRLQHKKDIKSSLVCDLVETGVNTDAESPVGRVSLDAAISTELSAGSSESCCQTDADADELSEHLAVRRQYIPIPIPVPLFVPAPVYLYARPVPYTLPFPLPCPIPFPVIPKDFSIFSERPGGFEAALTEPVFEFDESVLPKPSGCLVQTAIDSTLDPETSVPAPEVRSTVDENDAQLVIATDVISFETAHKSVLSERERPLKRSASPLMSNSDAESVAVHKAPQTDIDSVQSKILSHTATTTSATFTLDSLQNSRTVEPPAKKPRHTMVVSDANYHLKFSYGINAWRHWIQHKLSSLGGIHSSLVEKEYPHLRTELLNMSDLDLNTALTQFVCEVRKPNGECYVADSVFYLCLGIQEYLNENGCCVNLFGGPVFADFTKALDDVLANFQPRLNSEGLLVCRIEEEHLWEAQQLGHYTPEILLFTVLYFNTKHLGLRHGTVHRRLAFWQYQFIDEPVEDAAVLCHLSGSLYGNTEEDTSATIRLDANDERPERCPVKLLRNYCSRCPPSALSSEDAFYLVPVYPLNDENHYWFSAVAMESSDLQVMLNRIKMVKEIQEAFMNGQPDCGF